MICIKSNFLNRSYSSFSEKFFSNFPCVAFHCIIKVVFLLFVLQATSMKNREIAPEKSNIYSIFLVSCLTWTAPDCLGKWSSIAINSKLVILIHNYSYDLLTPFYSVIDSIVTLYRWPAKQTIPLSVLARNQTKGFWTWNLDLAGRGNGTREESWLEKGAGRQLAWDHGQGQSTPDTGAVRPAEKIGSSEEERVKRCRHSSCFVEFSLVTHASVSLHMHVVLHTFLLLWVNPKHGSCLFVCPSIFPCPPRWYSCSGKKGALPPSDH